MIKSITSGSGFTVVFEDGPLMIHRSSPNYEAAAAALAAQDIPKLRYLLDPVGAISAYTRGETQIAQNGDLLFHEKKVPGFCRDLLERCLNKKISWEIIRPFFENCTLNPSSRAIDELNDLLLSNEFALTDDGGLLAYKVVLPTYVDPDTGNHLCSPGRTVSVPRELVSRHGKTGSERGFVAGTSDYLASNTLLGKTLLVKIMPQDVIGVFNKPCRQVLCCRFAVISEKETPLPFAIYNEQLEPLAI